mgnify:CR=1 FL=1
MYLKEENINKNPFKQFEIWFEEAKKIGLKDPNAMNVASASKDGIPSSRMVLLKSYDENGFIFYTNLNSQKSIEIKENPNASMCFHWKSLLRQVRINGVIEPVEDKQADQYYNSRGYESRIGAWASKQSAVLNNRNELFEAISKFKEKFQDKENVPRPSHWSGWNLIPNNIEFWLDGEGRIHERLKYQKDNQGKWIKSLLSP